MDKEIQKWSKKEEPKECRMLSCVGKRSWGKGSQAQGLERFRVRVELRRAESSLDSPIGTFWERLEARVCFDVLINTSGSHLSGLSTGPILGFC